MALKEIHKNTIVNAKCSSRMKGEIVMFISLSKSAHVYSDDNIALRSKQLQREGS